MAGGEPSLSASPPPPGNPSGSSLA
jgi:hypothetical protein